MSLTGSLTTDPPGAEVSYRSYGAGDDAWQPLGQTPLEDVRLPRGIFEWRIELDGYEPRRLAEPNPSVLLANLATPRPALCTTRAGGLGAGNGASPRRRIPGQDHRVSAAGCPPTRRLPD